MRSRSGTIRTIDSEHRFDRPGWFGSADMVDA
jgi:fructose-1,6-bisphosphatase II